MEIVWIVFLTIFIYMAIVLVISGIRTLIAMRSGKETVKKSFMDTFRHFFIELLNPFNWI